MRKSYDSYLVCCIQEFNGGFTIDEPAERIPTELIKYYEIEITKPCAPYKICGYTFTEQTTVYPITVAKLDNGKYAYPIYEVTPLPPNMFGDSDEGTIELVGWCVQDTDLFANYKRRES